MTSATCGTCGKGFEVSADLRQRYPGWTPSECPDCYRKGNGGSSRASRAAPRARASSAQARVEEDLSIIEVLERYTDGPDTGVFTDGSAHPNPGPGGWGAVYVIDGEVVDQAYGHDPDTTNNRMELQALIEGTRLVPEGRGATLYTDSRLCSQTINEWAAGWKARGWKRKTGPIANLDLVRELYGIIESRPELEIEWIKAHVGYRWNEYADALSTAYRRDEL